MDQQVPRKNPKHKVARNPEFREVIYSRETWELLEGLRGIATRVMKALIECGHSPIVHGSVARGDVDRSSDVDVVIPYVVPPVLVEACLERNALRVYRKFVIRATPRCSLKVLYELDPDGLVTISYPLESFTPRELEFYKFGGAVSFEELRRGVRVPGVNKSLVLIVPTEQGHAEAPVVGYEHYVAKLLGISVETVLERVEVLSRRDEVGRTGLFLKQVLDPSMPVEEMVRRLLRK